MRDVWGQGAAEGCVNAAAGCGCVMTRVLCEQRPATPCAHTCCAASAAFTPRIFLLLATASITVMCCCFAGVSSMSQLRHMCKQRRPSRVCSSSYCVTTITTLADVCVLVCL
jgi:hypothetical protein